MKTLFPLIITAFVSGALPAASQNITRSILKGDLTDVNISLDVAVGASAGPSFPGSDDTEVSPWVSLRNLTIDDPSGAKKRGFVITPSFNLIGDREASDDYRLAGVHEIDYAYELGLKASYDAGPLTTYASLRQGFGGHHGIAGNVGAKYQFDPTDKLTIWTGIEAAYGNDEFNNTYFGITNEDASRTTYGAYSLDGGFNTATASLEARYHVTPKTALFGEIKYSRIIGDAEDSPVVLDKNQPSLYLGVIRTLNFGF